MEEAVAFGVPPVDKLLPPAPAGSAVLVVNEPGVEAEPFLYQAAHTHTGQGRPVAYLTTTRAPSSVREAMVEHGMDPDPEKSQLLFVDAFSALLGSKEDVAYTVQDPSDLSELVDALNQVADDHPGAVLLLDSLSGLADHASPEELLEVLPSLKRALSRFTYTAALFTDWPYGFDKEDLTDAFDAVVRVGGMEERVVFGQYFKVERARWAETLSGERHPFKVYKPGGVHVYIPKIVVTGPYNAGKSTFVHTVSDTAVSVDRLGTTVALDHGHVTVGGVTADIFGTPGQARFDPILRTVAGQALGVIVLVDATKPETFARAKELLAKTVQHGIPVIVGANKQDLPGALAPEEVARRLETPEHVRVIGCTGKDRASSRGLLSTMNDNIVLRGVAP